MWLNTKTRVPEDLVQDLLLHRCLDRGPEFIIISEIYYKYELDNGGYGYFYFENRSKHQIYYIAVELTEAMLNCKFSTSESNFSGAVRRPHASDMSGAWQLQTDRYPAIRRRQSRSEVSARSNAC